MTEVYVVFGSFGRGDDHSEWPVLAFADRAAAESRAARATEIAKRLKGGARRDGALLAEFQILDPTAEPWQVSDGGCYEVKTIPFEGEPCP